MFEFRPKKSLGQHFLVDKNIRDKIIRFCDLDNKDVVLEIGPGKGVLTKIIASQVKSLIAVEIDCKLGGFLKEEFKECKNTRIICQDILKFKIKEHFEQPIKIIGNLPFYITTPVIIHLLNQRQFIKSIFIMVPFEVAKRFMALPGTKDYSAFTCLLGYKSLPKILFHIKSAAFKPRPKVDVSFIRLDILSRPPVKVEDETLFFKIIRQAFSQRRKMLSQSLKGTISKSELAKAGIDFRLRPEVLKLEDFAALSNTLTFGKKS